MQRLAELEASRTPLKTGTCLPVIVVPYGMKETSITIGETKVQGWVPDTQGSQPEYCIFYGVEVKTRKLWLLPL